MSNMYKKYFITGGGTGGHIYPAIAVADALLEKDNCEIFYVGNPKNLEYNIVKDKNYTFLPVNVSGMPRKISLKLFMWLFQLLIAIIQASIYIYKYKPDAVFGTGGYVSAPTLIAAILNKKIPFVMHDCDSQPGLVTRKLSPYASSVSVAFEKAKEYIQNKKCYVNGNPLRPRFKTLSKSLAKSAMNINENDLVLLVMGGSQGAKTINNSFVEIIRELSEKTDIQIIFQTGKKNYDEVIKRIEKVYPKYSRNNRLVIKPYFDDMTTILKASDIVISRAGSLSLSEIFASEVAPVLIPYPYAAQDHQRKNAKYVEEKQACIYIEDKDADSNKLNEVIKALITNDELRNNLIQNSSNLAKLDGLSNIVEQVEQAGV